MTPYQVIVFQQGTRTLWRKDVANLTDAEWTAKPVGDDWVEEKS